MMKYFFTLLFFVAAFAGVAFSQQKPLSKTDPANNLKKDKTTNNPKSLLAPDIPHDLPVTYTFTGNGDWDNYANWENNLVPPPTTNAGSEIIIDNMPGGECLLNIPYMVTPGTVLTILGGKTLRVPGNLGIN